MSDGEMRHGKTKKIAQGRKASEEQSRNPNPGRRAPKTMLGSVHLTQLSSNDLCPGKQTRLTRTYMHQSPGLEKAGKSGYALLISLTKFSKDFSKSQRKIKEQIFTGCSEIKTTPEDT